MFWSVCCKGKSVFYIQSIYLTLAALGGLHLILATNKVIFTQTPLSPIDKELTYVNPS